MTFAWMVAELLLMHALVSAQRMLHRKGKEMARVNNERTKESHFRRRCKWITHGDVEWQGAADEWHSHANKVASSSLIALLTCSIHDIHREDKWAVCVSHHLPIGMSVINTKRIAHVTGTEKALFREAVDERLTESAGDTVSLADLVFIVFTCSLDSVNDWPDRNTNDCWRLRRCWDTRGGWLLLLLLLIDGERRIRIVLSYSF